MPSLHERLMADQKNVRSDSTNKLTEIKETQIALTKNDFRTDVLNYVTCYPK